MPSLVWIRTIGVSCVANDWIASVRTAFGARSTCRISTRSILAMVFLFSLRGLAPSMSPDQFEINTAGRYEMADVKKSSPDDNVHLIVAEDEEVVIEHHPEDWIAFVLFW